MKSLLNEIVELVYFMRGAVSYTEMMSLSYVERQLISEFLNNRLEVEAKKIHPNY